MTTTDQRAGSIASQGAVPVDWSVVDEPKPKKKVKANKAAQGKLTDLLNRNNSNKSPIKVAAKSKTTAKTKPIGPLKTGKGPTPTSKGNYADKLIVLEAFLAKGETEKLTVEIAKKAAGIGQNRVADAKKDLVKSGHLVASGDKRKTYLSTHYMKKYPNGKPK